MAARPFGELAARHAGAVAALAKKVGKQVRVDVEGKEVPIPAPVARVLGGALAALCRNAVAHGVERPDVREDRGKPRAGHLLLACEAGAGSPKVTVEDDGAGLDTERIRARAAALGVAVPAGGAKDSVFAPGLTTAAEASDLAGRGQGLARRRRGSRTRRLEGQRLDRGFQGYAIHDGAPLRAGRTR